MDFNKDHPRVFFPSDSPGDIKTVGFLFLVDGEVWAAKTPEDAKARFPAIPFPLEPKHLRGLPDTEQGERRFEYLGLVPRRPASAHGTLRESIE
jgi:hypothetical protein